MSHEKMADWWIEGNKLFQRFLADEEGATAIEYCLILIMIFLAIVTAVREYANSTSAMYSEIASAVA